MQINMTYLIVGSVLVIFIAVGIYFFLRYMKGSVKLYLDESSFNPGDTIKGQVELRAKQAITGHRLVVRLIGKKEMTREDNEGKSKTTTKEIFRSEKKLEGARNYPAGFTQTYDFELKTPQGSARSEAGDMIDTALSFITDQHSGYKWYVDAYLDADGVDLGSGSERVYINIDHVQGEGHYHRSL